MPNFQDDTKAEDKTNLIEEEIKKHISPNPGMPNLQGSTKVEDNN